MFQLQLGILDSEGNVHHVTCFSSSMSLILNQDPSNEEIEAKILETYEEKMVKATYFEKRCPKQLILESIEIIV